MAYASISGRARTSSRSPRAFAVCDRCGIWYNRDQLRNQFEWRGAQLLPLYIFVCASCYDVPQEQLRAITLPADPVPVYLPRPEDFVTAETDYRAVSAPPAYDRTRGIPIPGTTLRTTEDCENRTTLPFGRPTGENQNAITVQTIPLAFGTALSVLSVISNGTATVTVTCSAPHGLSTNGQVSIEGLADNSADGMYSVIVTSATAFTYMTYSSVGAAPLLLPNSRIITTKIGLPYGYVQIPKIYGPLLNQIATAACVFALENSTGFFYLENNTGYMRVESCGTAPVTYEFELEENTGSILLEDGTEFLEQEVAP
jgi:hypothetical protein